MLLLTFLLVLLDSYCTYLCCVLRVMSDFIFTSFFLFSLPASLLFSIISIVYNLELFIVPSLLQSFLVYFSIFFSFTSFSFLIFASLNFLIFSFTSFSGLIFPFLPSSFLFLLFVCFPFLPFHGSPSSFLHYHSLFLNCHLRGHYHQKAK